MKFLHTADLHIGKKIYEQSLLEDQKYILEKIYEVAMEEQVDAVVIAGDVYDRAVPSAEAVLLLDSFLTRLIQAGVPVLLISGNHDSPERVSFAGRILESQGLYIAGNYQEIPKTITMEDRFGRVHFVLLPFVKSAVAGAQNAAEAVEQLLARIPVISGEKDRLVLVTHFFVTGAGGETPELSDSEETAMVGGLDSVPSTLFERFSYVALGHIHKPQHMGGGRIYYAGSPLKYSFSEWKTEKSVNIVELGQEREAGVRRVPIRPLHDMRCIRGRLEELLKPETVEANRVGEGVCCGIEDYLQVTLTDLDELVDPIGTLRSVYPNVLQLALEKNQRDTAEGYVSRITGKRKSMTELFGDFYELLRGEPMDEKRQAVVQEVAGKISGEELPSSAETYREAEGEKV